MTRLLSYRVFSYSRNTSILRPIFYDVHNVCIITIRPLFDMISYWTRPVILYTFRSIQPIYNNTATMFFGHWISSWAAPILASLKFLSIYYALGSYFCTKFSPNYISLLKSSCVLCCCACRFRRWLIFFLWFAFCSVLSSALPTSSLLACQSWFSRATFLSDED